MTGYIKRDDVLDKKRTYLDIRYGTGSRTLVDVPAVLVSDIEDIPDEDVRPVKRGKWIPVTNGRGGHECDQCHNYAPSYQTGEERLSDFCPCCGADMMK